MSTTTRKDFLNMAQAAGGDTAGYTAAMALGLVNNERLDKRPNLHPQFGQGTSVIVLGAGVAGMVAAYELKKAGFDVNILESRQRAGGRVYTIRGGDTVVEVDSTQHVEWDREPHLYFNAGAARIPQHHAAVVDYCRELNVSLEVIINDNRGAYFQDAVAFGGVPKRSRSVVNDLRGFIAELAFKSVQPSNFDDPLSVEDLARVRDLLIEFGALSSSGRYCGSERIGHPEPLGAGFQDEFAFNAPLEFKELLQSAFWRQKINFGELLDSAATILQPVGGMDRITEAFRANLAGSITFGATVERLERDADGARVVWRDSLGNQHSVSASYVVCTIPFPVLTTIETDFSPAVKASMPKVEYINGGKVAFQAYRFWEKEYSIYGGISWTSEKSTQLWYPSHGIHKEKGILTGAFIQTSVAGEAFAQMTPRERLEMALAGCEQIHPGFAREVTGGTSISWKKVPHSLGGWAHWEPDTRSQVYPLFVRPDGPYYFAGEHISNMTGWQEGAIRSVYAMISQMVQRTASERKARTDTTPYRSFV